AVLAAASLGAAKAPAPAYDLVIRGGEILDGSGGKPIHGDIAVKGERIAYVGPDGRGLSELRQGVTLEVMGEGSSVGPLTPKMQRLEEQREHDVKFPVTWTTLDQGLESLAKRGLALNVASFVGAATVRVNVLGEDDVQPTPAQLERMRALVRA